jgi:hypothetical protein
MGYTGPSARRRYILFVTNIVLSTEAEMDGMEFGSSQGNSNGVLKDEITLVTIPKVPRIAKI